VKFKTFRDLGYFNNVFKRGEFYKIEKVGKHWFEPSLKLIQPPDQGTSRTLSPGEAGEQHSVEVQNARSYTSTPPYVFMAWCFIKQRKSLNSRNALGKQCRSSGG
jgi:hypothetical protein